MALMVHTRFGSSSHMMRSISVSPVISRAAIRAAAEEAAADHFRLLYGRARDLARDLRVGAMTS
jgi:hypothetical protein